MKRILATAALVLFVGVTTAASLAAQEKVDSLDQARINRLIHDLGSDSPATRDQATQDLRNLGREALPALREAEKSADPEVAYRAQRLVEELDQRAKPKDDGDESTAPQTRRPHGMPGTGFSFGFSGNGNFSLQRDSNGHIKLTVKEEKDGEQVNETYEADSVAEFVKRYPEVAKKYGITERGGGITIIPGFPGGNGPGSPLDPEMKELQEALMNQLRDVLKDSRKSLEEMFKGFKGLRDRNGKEFDESFPFGKDLFAGEEDDNSDLEDEEAMGKDEAKDSKTVPPVDEDHKKILERFRENQRKGRLNDGMQVEYISPALRSQLGLEGEDGVQVAEVEEGSASEQAGIRKFDVILKVNGRPVRASLEFRRVLKEAVASGKLVFDVIRKGKPSTIEVSGAALEAFRK